MVSDEDRSFVLANTRPSAAPLVPEVALRLADEPFALWERVPDSLPFWAFAWAGGQALARYVLDRPELVAGRRVLDLASGSGLVAIAAALAGAASVRATDLDPRAVAAIGINAAANGVTVAVDDVDVLGGLVDVDVLLAGDVCYDRTTAERMIPFLAEMARDVTLVLVGDPGRPHFPRAGFRAVGRYDVPVTGNLEAEEITPTTVWTPADW